VDVARMEIRSVVMAVTYLLNMMVVLKRGGRDRWFWREREKEEEQRRGWWTLAGMGTGGPLAFPGRFCRWSRDEPSVLLQSVLFTDFSYTSF
jgi:hypothetical protein